MRTKRQTAAVPMPVRENQEHNISVRKIDNGYIARHSTMDTKGSGYKQREVYHPTKPTIKVSVNPGPGKKK